MKLLKTANNNSHNMGNQEKNNIYQSRLIEQIQQKLPLHQSIIDVLSELLNISSDSVYRRIRGDKTMTFEEVALLSSHFSISLDEILQRSDANHLKCTYIPLDLSKKGVYHSYMEALANKMENLRLSFDKEIFFSAVDIPFYHFLPYKELTFFKLFSWNNSVYGFNGGYDDFVNQLEHKEAILACYDKLINSYKRIPSKEIWTEGTIDTFLRLLNYHFEIGHFTNKETPLKLCEQLLNMINKLNEWSEKGIKGESGESFKLYISEIDLENSYILLKSKNRTGCILKLFTINSMEIIDERFCMETEKWLNSLAKRATLVSETSEKERYKFFNSQRQKIGVLVDKINNYDLF